MNLTVTTIKFLERTAMKTATPFQDKINGVTAMIQDLARQHQQLAENQAQLLQMILDQQLQIEQLKSQRAQ